MRNHFLNFSPFSSKRQRNVVIAVAAAAIIVVILVAFAHSLLLQGPTAKPEFFVGVDVGFGDEADVRVVADAVAGSANLIIIGSLNVTTDPAKLTRVCDYLYEKNFYFIIYVGLATNESEEGLFPARGPDPDFFEKNQARWGDKLLGAYIFDEPGGKQVDRNHPPVTSASNISSAAIHYILGVECYLKLYGGPVYYDVPGLKLFTSDYALYWYDYLSGYRVVFGEFLQNQSRPTTVALCRGAANAIDNDWGIIVTSASCVPGQPQLCLENASALYNDLLFAWQSGAKYMVVFDSATASENSSTGLLTQEHFNAIKSFWRYASSNAKPPEFPADTAYVLPADYGYGFRGPNEMIWGLFPADSLTQRIWNDVNSLLPQYGNGLDIVYETRTDGVPVNLKYDKLIFWNGTVVQR